MSDDARGRLVPAGKVYTIVSQQMDDVTLAQAAASLGLVTTQSPLRSQQ